MQVMILAAGRGSRLGHLGTVLPKPLVPICGYPAITFGLALCRHAELKDVVVNLHHHGDLIRRALGDGAAFGVAIRYSEEVDLLGTGGGVAKARPLFRSGSVLIVNGKVVADVDLARVLESHRQWTPSGVVGTMVLRDDPRASEFAPVGVDATGGVVSIRGQRTDRTPVGPIADRMFTGIHVLEPGLLDHLPPAGESDLIADAYLPALNAGKRVQSTLMTGYFAEHSTPERYLEGNLALLRNPALVPVAPGPLAGVDPAAEVHPSAQVIMPSRIAAGAVVEAGAVVGPEAVVCGGGRVARGARVEGSVVWEGAVAEGDVRGRVVSGAST